VEAIFFDLETTGRDTSQGRIVEIAAYNSARQTSFQRLVNPGVAIPKDASAIHGITDEMVREAPSFDVAAKEFIEFCSGAVMLVAHNGELFDLPFLQAEFRRHALSFPGTWIFVDSLKWARKYRKDLPRHALQYLREFFGFSANKAHRALDDVITLHRIFSLLTDDLTCEEIIERIGGIRPSSEQEAPQGELVLF
jgi:DNA polymerase-3 subunit epsilon